MRPKEFIKKHIDEASLALISLMRIDPTMKAAKDYCVFMPCCMLSPPPSSRVAQCGIQQLFQAIFKLLHVPYDGGLQEGNREDESAPGRSCGHRGFFPCNSGGHLEQIYRHHRTLN